MSANPTLDRTVSAVEAARTLFRTHSPSDEQMLSVFRLMRSGTLRAPALGGPPAAWTTTASALAELMASNAMQRSSSRRPKPAESVSEDDGEPAVDAAECLSTLESASRARSSRSWGEFAGVYREIWRDYFFAMLLRRRAQERGASFQRAVVIGQATLLVLLVTMIVTASVGVRSLFKSAGHAAILERIDSSTDEFSVTQWHKPVPAPEGEGELVRVEYRYRKDSHRWIHTDRMFLVSGNKAVEVELD